MDARLSDINFFISSTYVDMKDYRDAVIKHISSRAGIISAQEFFGARNQEPLETCLEELEKSQVFVMFLGPRYGSVHTASGKSYVEREYDRARDRGMPCFAYINDENQSFPFKSVSKGEDAERLANFKSRVQKDLTIGFFTTPDDLAAKVFDDLRRELPKSGFNIGSESPEAEKNSCVQTLKEFQALPKLFHGRDVKFVAKLGVVKRVSESECAALSLNYGAAIKRNIFEADGGVQSVLGRQSYMFSDDDDAIRLYNITSGKAVVLEAKTTFGEENASTPIYGFKREYGYMSSVSGMFDKERVIVDFDTSTNLICGLKFVDYRLV